MHLDAYVAKVRTLFMHEMARETTSLTVKYEFIALSFKKLFNNTTTTKIIFFDRSVEMRDSFVSWVNISVIYAVL